MERVIPERNPRHCYLFTPSKSMYIPCPHQTYSIAVRPKLCIKYFREPWRLTESDASSIWGIIVLGNGLRGTSESCRVCVSCTSHVSVGHKEVIPQFVFAFVARECRVYAFIQPWSLYNSGGVHCRLLSRTIRCHGHVEKEPIYVCHFCLYHLTIPVSTCTWKCSIHFLFCTYGCSGAYRQNDMYMYSDGNHDLHYDDFRNRNYFLEINDVAIFIDMYFAINHNRRRDWTVGIYPIFPLLNSWPYHVYEMENWVDRYSGERPRRIENYFLADC